MQLPETEVMIVRQFTVPLAVLEAGFLISKLGRFESIRIEHAGKDTLRAIATDGHILMEVPFESEIQNDEFDESFVLHIPNHLIPMLKKSANLGLIMVRQRDDQKWEAGFFSVFTTFPEVMEAHKIPEQWRQTIPKDVVKTGRIGFGVGLMEQAVKVLKKLKAPNETRWEHSGQSSATQVWAKFEGKDVRLMIMPITLGKEFKELTPEELAKQEAANVATG